MKGCGRTLLPIPIHKSLTIRTLENNTLLLNLLGAIQHDLMPKHKEDQDASEDVEGGFEREEDGGVWGGC